MTVVLLYFIWLLFWAIYNFVLLPQKISTEKTPRILCVFYFIFSLSSLFISHLLFLLPNYFTLSLLVIILCLATNHPQTGRLNNSLFQITWLYCFLPTTGVNFFYLALIFGLGHLPIFTIQHLSIFSKFLILILSFTGGLVLSFCLVSFSYPTNLLFGVLIHYLFYLFLRPFDNKFKLNIIN